MVVENSAGRRDYILTMTVWCFSILMVKFLLAGLSFSHGSFSLAFTSPDATLVASIFGPLLATYAARRYTERSFDSKDLATNTLAGAQQQPVVPVDPTQQ